MCWDCKLGYSCLFEGVGVLGEREHGVEQRHNARARGLKMHSNHDVFFMSK